MRHTKRPLRQHTDETSPDYAEFIRRMYKNEPQEVKPTDWLAIIILLAVFWSVAMGLAYYFNH